MKGLDDLEEEPGECVYGSGQGGRETVWRHLRDHYLEQHFSSDHGVLEMAPMLK